MGLHKGQSNKGSFRKNFIPWNKGLKGFMKGRKVSFDTRLKSSLSQRGEKNHAWKGGKNPKSYYKTFEYQIWRNKVLKRDNFTCKICDKQCFFPIVHHIKNNSVFPELQYDVNNGITLCYDCHMLVHRVSFYRLKGGELSENLKQATLSQVWEETSKKVQRIIDEAKKSKTFMPIISIMSAARESDDIC